jgi:hypothetical protein
MVNLDGSAVAAVYDAEHVARENHPVESLQPSSASALRGHSGLEPDADGGEPVAGAAPRERAL